jgi:hypothetical protein
MNSDSGYHSRDGKNVVNGYGAVRQTPHSLRQTENQMYPLNNSREAGIGIGKIGASQIADMR